MHILPWFVITFANFVVALEDLPYTVIKREFEDTKGAIRIRISKKNRQRNGQRMLALLTSAMIVA